MFEQDKKRVKACIYYKDYFVAMEYSILVKDKYDFEERDFFENTIKCIKRADYDSLNTL